MATASRNGRGVSWHLPKGRSAPDAGQEHGLNREGSRVTRLLPQHSQHARSPCRHLPVSPHGPAAVTGPARRAGRAAAAAPGLQRSWGSRVPVTPTHPRHQSRRSPLRPPPSPPPSPPPVPAAPAPAGPARGAAAASAPPAAPALARSRRLTLPAAAHRRVVRPERRHLALRAPWRAGGSVRAGGHLARGRGPRSGGGHFGCGQAVSGRAPAALGNGDSGRAATRTAAQPGARPVSPAAARIRAGRGMTPTPGRGLSNASLCVGFGAATPASLGNVFNAIKSNCALCCEVT